MPSFHQLLAAHAPLLVLDAASARVQMGWVRGDGHAAWQASEEESGVGLFQGIDRLGVRLEEAGAFVFCEGPGSVLGIRTTAMAIRTWCALQPRPVFAYTSLALVAHTLGRPKVGVIADARRESWHHFDLEHGLRRLPTAELGVEIVMPENFRHWSTPPPNLARVAYDLADLLPRALNLDLFRPITEPDAFLHEEPNYVRWTPQIHRAPSLS